MFNSTIERKLKPCASCGKMCYWFSRKRCVDCARREDSSPIQKALKEKTEEDKTHSAEMDKWFAARRDELTGKCSHCGGKTCKDSDRYFKCSIAHILPKRLFRSVATHPLNFIELCFWGNACHTNMDNYMLDLTDMNCWDEIVEKFIAMYPAIDPKERKYIPDTLRQYVNLDV